MKSPARENVAREKWGVGVIKKSKLLAFVLIAGFLVFCPNEHASDALAKIPQDIDLPEEAVSMKILGNGLSVLVAEGGADNLVAIHVTVRASVVSEGEYLGSGISHLIEHMLFKGTKIRGPQDIEKEVKSFGGIFNGAVSQDMTYYYMILPSTKTKEAISLIKDMLYNAAFDPDELKKEKDVILKEIRLTRDDPQRRIARLLNERAYLVHPYKYPAIGYEDKFIALTREDLIIYYNHMYVPNRITISIAGDVDPSETISMIENEFRDFRPPDYASRDSNVIEPLQISARFYQEEFPASLSYLSIAFHSTSFLNSDLFAMDVLAMILGSGDASRLNTSLYKKSGLVHSIACWNYTPKDPGLFVISAILDRDKLEEAKKVILEEISAARNGYVSDQELEGARRMVTSYFLQSLESVKDRASAAATNYVLTGNQDFSRLYVKGIQEVTKEGIKRVANKYLRPENLTVISLVPPGMVLPVSKKASGTPAKDVIHKETLPNGLRLLVRENRTLPAISLTIAMGGGLALENAHNNGISNLTSRMLLKGTSSRKEDMIQGFLERLGADLNAFSGMNSFGLNMFVLKPDLETGLEVLKDILSNSIFPQEEIDKEVSLTIAAIKNEEDDIFARGFNTMRKNLFGGSPYSLRYIGEEKSLRSLEREDLIAFYRAYCIPNNMVISISGDIEPQSLMKKLRETFKGLKPGKTVISIPSPHLLKSAKSETVNMDRYQSLLVLGFQTTTLNDPDRYILDVMGSILSGSSGRLFTGIRDKDSLAYTLGLVQKLGLGAGYLAFYIATTSENIPQVKKELSAEIDRIRTADVSDDELAFAKKELLTARRLSMQSNDFFTLTSALDELYGLGYENLYKYSDGINRVSKADIKRVADKYLEPNTSSEVIIIPEK